jgi:hypothetical protein
MLGSTLREGICQIRETLTPSLIASVQLWEHSTNFCGNSSAGQIARSLLI